MAKEYSELEQQVLAFLQERFDGVVAVDLQEDGTLYAELSGDCATCPVRELSCNEEMNAAVLEEFPQIERVSARPYVNEETLDFAKKLLGLK